MLLLLLACDRAPAEPGEATPLVTASRDVTFATVEGLGPHRMDASIERLVRPKGRREEQRTAEVVSLRWADPDNWHLVARRDGRVRSEMLVRDAVAWSSVNGNPLEERGDAEPYRVQLAQTWDPWKLTLESLEERVGLVQEALDEVEGRRVWRHAVRLLPAPERASRAWDATLAEGTVWIDELTAVRLVGKLHVEAESRTQHLQLDLQFAVSGVGADPELPRPPEPASP